ncbi:MAG: STAS domain-containing protein [Spartobacteria bacterium]|nr:STAS domain-containing protein [Spartobacteria bacterium]
MLFLWWHYAREVWYHPCKQTGDGIVEITAHCEHGIVQLTLVGRLDTFGANALDPALAAREQDDVFCVVLDMAQTSFISSAGVRVLMAHMKKLKARSGMMALCAMQPFCKEVLEATGLADFFLQFDTVDAALRHGRQIHAGLACARRWDTFPHLDTNCGALRYLPAAKEPAAICVAGRLKDIQRAQVTPRDTAAMPYRAGEYSIGIGGMGARPEDCFSTMGDMITAENMIAWRPTDTHHLPDFLVPRTESAHLTLQTAFRLSLSASFNEWILFDSDQKEGVPLKHLYKELFRISRERRADYRGVMALAMRMDCGRIRGTSLKRAPIQEMAPANGKLIEHPSNVETWFAGQTERPAGGAALLCAFGANLKDDLSDFDEELFNRVFYINPTNAATQTELIHANGILFEPLEMDIRPGDIHTEASKLIDQGHFLDMCRVDDTTEVKRALIGMAYIQAIEAIDPPAADIPRPPEFDLQPAAQKRLAYYKGLHMR